MMISLSVSIMVRNSKLGIYPLDEQNTYGGSVCLCALTKNVSGFQLELVNLK